MITLGNCVEMGVAAVAGLNMNFISEMKKNSIVLLLLLLLSVSCNRNRYSLVDLSRSATLDLSDVFIEFDDKYPVGIRLKDSIAFLIEIKANTCLLAIDLKHKELIKSFGNYGRGPNELLNPEFITSLDRNNIFLEDNNSLKIARIEADLDESLFKVLDSGKFPEAIAISSEVNFSQNYIIGRSIGKSEESFFFIFNKNTNTRKDVYHKPFFTEDLVDPNFTYASSIALNENKNRIIVGMYFFDLFFVYDLNGEIIHSFCFSENFKPQINDKLLNFQESYSGIISVFPTENYCYLMRITTIPELSTHKRMLIQVDWEGNLINSYTINENMERQFYIDEAKKTMFAIVNYTKEDQDLFGLVSYKLK